MVSYHKLAHAYRDAERHPYDVRNAFCLSPYERYYL